MKNITRLSLVLSVLFLLVTSNESNASIQSQQANQQTNFNNSYLPDYTVNTIDSEEAPVQLARKWGRNKSKHPCLRPNARSRMAKSRGFKSYCKKYKIKKDYSVESGHIIFRISLPTFSIWCSSFFFMY